MKFSQVINFIRGKKDVILTILPSVVIIGIYTILFPSTRGKQYKLEIKQLQALNDSLKKENDSILYQIENIKIDMERSDEIIHTLFDESRMFEEKAKNLSNELKTIKKQYDQASNHANSFTSGEIVEYFSNIK
jgi:predicted nuclease with TOPRIM domain